MPMFNLDEVGNQLQHGDKLSMVFHKNPKPVGPSFMGNVAQAAQGAPAGPDPASMGAPVMGASGIGGSPVGQMMPPVNGMDQGPSPLFRQLLLQKLQAQFPQS